MASSPTGARKFEFGRKNRPLSPLQCSRRTPETRVARALPTPRATSYSLEHAKRPRRGLGPSARGPWPPRLYASPTAPPSSLSTDNHDRPLGAHNAPWTRSHPRNAPDEPRATTPRPTSPSPKIRPTHTTDITAPPSSSASRRAASRASPELSPAPPSPYIFWAEDTLHNIWRDSWASSST